MRALIRVSSEAKVGATFWQTDLERALVITRACEGMEERQMKTAEKSSRS